MELYKLTAHLNNTSTSFIFDYLPENFEGVNISQKFSFVNPMGYTPKFSIDTMRIIGGNGFTIDSVFLQYGLESDVTIDIQELNADGFTYGAARTFAIDFESYEIFDYYSEFALKSVSVIDVYNKAKNTERIFELPLITNLDETNQYIPTLINFMNYVSVRSTTYSKIYAGWYFEKNNESKIYNEDIGLPTNYIYYKINNVDFGDVNISINVSLKISLSTTSIHPTIVEIGNSIVGFIQCLIIQSGEIEGFINGVYAQKLDINDITVSSELSLYLKVTRNGVDVTSIATPSGLISLDVKRQSNIQIVDDYTTIYFNRFSNILEELFPNVTYDLYCERTQLTSANCITKGLAQAVAKPVDLINDLCVVTGSIINFKMDGSVEFKNNNNFFNDLFQVDIDSNPINFIAIDDFKDLSIKYSNDLMINSVEVGCEPNDYETYIYNIDWNKILTFGQEDRNSSEVADLTLRKCRVDYSGIIDNLVKASRQDTKNSKDLFIYYPKLRIANNAFGIGSPWYIWDSFTPKDILTNWTKYLSFIFQNFSKNKISLISNGGTDDDLLINMNNQFTSLTLNETKRLLPISYTFTALIDDVDFSEKILKINHNDEDVYIFVTNSETTDQLTEQTITGLKIQF
jgi:hypothetical protein